MKKILTLLLLSLCFFGNAQNDVLFKTAADAYNKGNYEKAAEDYLKIIENGQHSAAVYYNLGNAYYKLNKVAPSIYYFEKALLLKPNDPEIKNNLGYAQNMALDAIEVSQETGMSRLYHSVISFLSYDQWAYTAILLMFVFVLAYIAFYYFRYASYKRIAFIGSFIALFLSVLSVLMAYLQYNTIEADQPAIVFSEAVGVKAEPNDRTSDVFTLHEGAKVNVLETFNNWKKIELADGKTGWLLDEHIKLLKNF